MHRAEPKNASKYLPLNKYWVPDHECYDGLCSCDACEENMDPKLLVITDEGTYCLNCYAAEGAGWYGDILSAEDKLKLENYKNGILPESIFTRDQYLSEIRKVGPYNFLLHRNDVRIKRIV